LQFDGHDTCNKRCSPRNAQEVTDTPCENYTCPLTQRRMVRRVIGHWSHWQADRRRDGPPDVGADRGVWHSLDGDAGATPVTGPLTGECRDA
jgi:hypothetical protein